MLCNVVSVCPQHARTRARSSYVLLVSSMRPTCNPECAGDARMWLAFVRTRRTGPCDLQARSVKLRLCSMGPPVRAMMNTQDSRAYSEFGECVANSHATTQHP